MNFLKKKLKAHKKEHISDDDYDDYIPPVPPHPSEIEAYQERQRDLLTCDTVASNGTPPDLTKILAEKNINKEKEEWKFLERLNQRVAATVNRTTSALEKIKDKSTAEEIANKPEFEEDEVIDPKAFLKEGISGIVAKQFEYWFEFDNDKDFPSKIEKKKNKPERPPLPTQKSVSKQSDSKLNNHNLNTKIVNSSNHLNSNPNLLDDFGFGYEPQPNNTENSSLIFDYENDYLDDPFDTSFVDISSVEPQAAANSIIPTSALSNNQLNCDNLKDPFNTVFIENAIQSDSLVFCSTQPINCENVVLTSSKDTNNFSDSVNCDRYLVENTCSNRLEKSSQYSSKDSIASIMSNPFLIGTDYYTPTIRSGTTTPFSGTITPRRRSSTNPFEQSLEEEYSVVNTEASAIAALTEDFCKAIGDISTDDNINSSPPHRHSSNFDPFETIYDDYIDSPIFNTTADNFKSGNLNNDILETSNKQETYDNLLTVSDAHLDYFSDFSDAEDVSKSEKEKLENKTRLRSSSFQMDLLDRDKKEPPPTFDPLPNVIRKASFPLGEEETNEATNSKDIHKNIKTGNDFFYPFDMVVDRDSPPTPPYYEEHLNKPCRDNYHNDEILIASEKINRCDSKEFQDSSQPNFIESNTNRHDSQILSQSFHEENQPSKVRDKFLSKKYFSLKEKQTPTSFKEKDLDHIISSPESPEILDSVDQLSKIEKDTSTNSDSDLVENNKDSNNDLQCVKDSFDASDVNTNQIQDFIPFTDSNAFDAFEAKFDRAQDKKNQILSDSFDPFVSTFPENEFKTYEEGFDSFDPFSTLTEVIKGAPSEKQNIGHNKPDSFDNDDDHDNFKVVIKARLRENRETKANGPVSFPSLAPPPKTVIKAFADSEQNEKNESEKVEEFDEYEAIFGKDLAKMKSNQTEFRSTNKNWSLPKLTEEGRKRSDLLESPQTSLFDEDDTTPLEDFPAKYHGDGWEMYLRHPAKKKLTGNRFWKKVFVRLSENSVIQLFNKKTDNEPFQELPLQACYSLSEISSQQYDQYGKIFTIKLQYIFYRERVSVRKNQIAKVMQGQIPSMSSIAKFGIPLEHVPQISQLLKLGSQSYSDLKVFAHSVEDCFFKMVIHRDRALTYKTEEIQCTIQDEYYVEQTKTGLITKQLARVRIFLLAFLNGMPCIEIGVNDIARQGKEVVGRHDIIPVVTEEWIRLEACEFHCAVIKEEFEKESRLIKLHPPDACFVEVMRFRVRPPKNKELPMQVSTNLYVTKTKVELRCEVLVPGCISRKHGQIPCEDISIRIHIPECWIYFFRTEKHLRYGSVKSASRRPGKIKGIERFLGTTQNIEPTLLEASAGQAKYEHAFHSLVWRIPRLPKDGQGSYTTQLMVLRLPLTSFDQIPESFYEYVDVEFTMPVTTVSHAVIRSISVTNENPPEKFVHYVAKHEYKVEMSINFSYSENEYVTSAVSNFTSHSAITSKLEPETVNKEEEKSDDSD